MSIDVDILNMTNSNRATLKLHCADAPGIVHAVTDFIFNHGGNIVTSQQYRESLDDQFFMRVHFDCDGLDLAPAAFEAAFTEVAKTFGMTFFLRFSTQKPRLAILVSKYDHCLYDLFLRNKYGELNAEIALVISNHEDLAPVAKEFCTPFFHVPVKKENKAEADGQMLDLCKQHGVELVVLARYMQIIGDGLLNHYRRQIINVHHGFLPAFKGAKPYHQAYERGVKIIGATSHYATPELDMGPIIEQETAHVGHSHNVQDMIRLGRDLEKQVLAKAVRYHVDQRIMVYKNRTVIFSAI